MDVKAYQAGARAMLNEAFPRLPALLVRALDHWVEVELANAAEGEPLPPPPSTWDDN